MLKSATTIVAISKHSITLEKSKAHAFIATWLGEAFDAMEATIFYIVMVPALGDLLHTNDYTSIGIHSTLILACFMIGWAIGCILFGAIADRFGRINAMIYGILLYAVACALCATSHNWYELAVYRFLVGLGIGGEINVGIIYLTELWQPKGRAWALSLSQTSFPVGMLLVSIFTYGLGTFGWRALFLAGILPALLTFYIRRSLTEAKLTDTQSDIKQTILLLK